MADNISFGESENLDFDQEAEGEDAEDARNSATENLALQLAQTFYQSLADGLPVDLSITEARNAMSLAVPKAEWGVPVLYMRSPDGMLFELDTKQELAKQM